MLRDILSKRFTAKHWDVDKSIEQSTIDYIVDCTYLAPSKLAARLHKIVVLTETPKAKEIKNWLFYNHTYNTDGVRSKEEGKSVKMFNGQYIAPVVLAWLNPVDLPSWTEREYGGKTMTVNTPGFLQRHNDIFISSMCAVAAAEEQGLNTGFGSCHNHAEVASQLGFDGYECPIMVGIGYAKDMTDEERKHGILIPILDPDDHSTVIGYDASNITADRDASPNRNYTQPKESMIITI
jgi:hypothetical protein